MKEIAVHNLYKSYDGKTAVKDLTLYVNHAEILGLIGPNGAGKSSTIKIILDFMKPDSGEVKIFGHQMKEASNNQIGYPPKVSVHVLTVVDSTAGVIFFLLESDIHH